MNENMNNDFMENTVLRADELDAIVNHVLDLESKTQNIKAKDTSTFSGEEHSIGDNIHALVHGKGLIATNENEVVFGQYNSSETDKTRVFSIGNGTNDDLRSDLVVFYDNGEIKAYDESSEQTNKLETIANQKWVEAQISASEDDMIKDQIKPLQDKDGELEKSIADINKGLGEADNGIKGRLDKVEAILAKLCQKNYSDITSTADGIKPIIPIGGLYLATNKDDIPGTAEKGGTVLGYGEWTLIDKQFKEDSETEEGLKLDKGTNGVYFKYSSSSNNIKCDSDKRPNYQLYIRFNGHSAFIRFRFQPNKVYTDSHTVTTTENGKETKKTYTYYKLGDIQWNQISTLGYNIFDEVMAGDGGNGAMTYSLLKSGELRITEPIKSNSDPKNQKVDENHYITLNLTVHFTPDQMLQNKCDQFLYKRIR